MKHYLKYSFIYIIIMHIVATYIAWPQVSGYSGGASPLPGIIAAWVYIVTISIYIIIIRNHRGLLIFTLILGIAISLVSLVLLLNTLTIIETSNLYVAILSCVILAPLDGVNVLLKENIRVSQQMMMGFIGIAWTMLSYYFYRKGEK